MDDAKERAARLCSQSEQCSAGIRNKLRQWQVPEKDVEPILTYLKQEQFLDDRRYCRFFVKDKFRLNRWGKIKIRHMLIVKGIPEELIEEAFEEIPEEAYMDTCLNLLKTRSRSLKETNPLSRKAKLIRFTAQRGFETEVIYKAMERMGD
ncbi:MAG: RecX family transcriptional regulator [Bacteroidales bacterium]|nr:RecX family transcriptional regulator [Bacteroidales bacterium]